MKQNKLTTMLISVIVFMILVIMAFVVLLCTRVKREYSIEIGQEVKAEEFRRYSWDKGNYVWVELPDTNIPGEKRGKIQVFPITYQVTLLVKEQVTDDTPVITEEPEEPTPVPTETPAVVLDTEIPKVITQIVSVYAENREEPIAPEQFIGNIEDASECTVEYITAPDNTVNGIQTVWLKVTDSAGNYTEAESELYIKNIKEVLTLEVGTALPKAEEFLYAPGSEIAFVNSIDEISMMKEGTYTVVLVVDGIDTVSTLQIKDTTPPTLVLHNAETWLNKPVNSSVFIDYDLTGDNSDAFGTEFVTEPDWSVEGEHTVEILAKDFFGNTTTETATLLIKKDKKAPVVTVTDIDVKVGGTVSYKKAVSYYDDIDTKEEMKLSIQRDGVNLKEVGTYEVTYTVTDCSGNATSVVGKINVMKEAPLWEDEDIIHEKAQKILDSILKEGMTDREKAKEIYRWIKNNIGYISHSEKGNYIRGAYEGLFKQQGDCFVYASTAKELLTRAGIQNIDIVKATTNPSHYWNLVYIEDGWYHFDSTPRKDKSEFFLLTDAELEAYSSTHKNTHIFDRSLYPEIK